MNAIEENEFIFGWRNMGKYYKTKCYFMYFGALGNKRNTCYSHEKASDNS